MNIIDSHSHLWLRQDTVVDGQPIKTLHDGRSLFFGEEVQMLPPWLIDGRNSAEVFLSNMNYAQVGAAVVVQEIIDGQQNDYLLTVQQQYPDRFFCMGMPEFRFGNDYLDEAVSLIARGFRGLAIPGHRLTDIPLNSPRMMQLFEEMERRDVVLSICLADDERQIAEMAEVIQQCPRLRVAIGHFGLVTTSNWRKQILLARESENVRIESGGITWLYNSEFYPYPSAVRSIREAADMVGMDKLMWGSDYPRTITAITYRMSYDFISKSSELSETDKALFLGENAKQFYGFGPLPELPYIKNMSE